MEKVPWVFREERHDITVWESGKPAWEKERHWAFSVVGGPRHRRLGNSGGPRLHCQQGEVTRCGFRVDFCYSPWCSLRHDSRVYPSDPIPSGTAEVWIIRVVSDGCPSKMEEQEEGGCGWVAQHFKELVRQVLLPLS